MDDGVDTLGRPRAKPAAASVDAGRSGRRSGSSKADKARCVRVSARARARACVRGIYMTAGCALQGRRRRGRRRGRRHGRRCRYARQAAGQARGGER